MKQLLVKFRLKHGTYLAIALAMSVVSGSPPALSADKKDLRQREAQRRTQQAIKQAQAKNTELEQANTELAAQLKEKEQHAAEISIAWRDPRARTDASQMTLRGNNHELPSLKPD